MENNGNIDVRISNYLTILNNKEMCNAIGDRNAVYAMQEAVAIYAKGAIKMVNDYKREQAVNQQMEQVNNMMR